MTRRRLTLWKWFGGLAIVGVLLFAARMHREPLASDAGDVRPPASTPALTPAPAQLPGTLAPPAAMPQGIPPGMTTPVVKTYAVVDLNSASLTELETLPGITKEYAERIVAARPFQSVQDLQRTQIPRQILEGISPPALIRIPNAGAPAGGPRQVPPERAPRPRP